MTFLIIGSKRTIPYLDFSLNMVVSNTIVALF